MTHKTDLKKRRVLSKGAIYILISLIAMLGILPILPVKAQTATNLALNKTVTVSSTQSGLTAAAAVDGSTGTRWGSDWSDPQWIYVDLGATYTINRVVLR